MVCILDDLFASTSLRSAAAFDISFVVYAHRDSTDTFLFASNDVPGWPVKVTDDPEKQWLQYAKSKQPVITGFKEPELNVDWQMLIWPSRGWQQSSQTFVLEVGLCVLFTLGSLVSLWVLLLKDTVSMEVDRFCDSCG
ncbi:unnamed protein product [Polarella glacialis]|uniref:Uncharacterized protein n=1 Tax=Polarella glacialis TaxID=89957 RepID=A0A813FPB1_POLGL|nr:unnamed protein product [Polarella glacialis]